MHLDYCKSAPPTFTGDGDPIAAQNFIINSETCFDSLGIPAKRKVKLAASQLKGNAQKWWRHTKSVHGSRMTWTEFVGHFYEQYFPAELQRAKQLEFHTLVQGPEVSVLEYAQKFNELGEFCPQEMKDEVGKALKFEGGLRSEIRSLLATHLGDTYGNVLSRALKAEADMKRVAALSNSRNSNPSQISRSSSGHGSGQSIGQKLSRGFKNLGKGLFKKGSSSGSSAKKGPCPTCGNYHNGPCMKRSNACYNCGEEGHYAAQCPAAQGTAPARRSAAAQPQQQAHAARAHNLSRQREIGRAHV